MSDKILVDMFEVQLGAAMLLQFRVGEGVVRILADAGVHASGYPTNHVYKKLKSIFEEDLADPRLDLIIGTHYDADHLEGLVPILEDEEIEVGQLWLPPVANDEQSDGVDAERADHQFLADQFAGENHHEVLATYISQKRNKEMMIGELLLGVERRTTQGEGADYNSDYHSDAELAESDSKYFGDLSAEIRSLRQKLSKIHDELGDHEPHGGPAVDGDGPIDAQKQIKKVAKFASRALRTDFRFASPLSIEVARSLLNLDPSMVSQRQRSLVRIQQAAVKDAINAASLYKVVRAAKSRGITAECEVIDDGQPRRFEWRQKTRRFIGARKGASVGPILSLLGPSKALVIKHRDRLPIGDYIAMAFVSSIPIKSITPSNQLSYVARIEYESQGLLIAGDAGFVDFSIKRGKYYPNLISSLLPLHVVQVAHHGGANAHFYRVLLEAGLAEQEDNYYLLLSHATNDKYRPSREFRLFIEHLRNERSDPSVKVLFTSEPMPSKVRAFVDVVAPPTLPAADRGDIRLAFSYGEWAIKRHSIKV